MREAINIAMPWPLDPRRDEDDKRVMDCPCGRRPCYENDHLWWPRDERLIGKTKKKQTRPAH